MINKLIYLVALISTCYTTTLAQRNNTSNSEKHYETVAFEKIVTDAGFEFEEHFVTTSDGYILSLWRIPGQIEES